MANKYNPFRPDKMAPPGLFAGRLEEIRFIDHCLLQTKDGNPQHFLIEGEKGIGKSSLFWLEEYVATGEIETMETNKFLNFIVVSVSLQEQDDYFSIIRKFSTGLSAEIKKREKLKALGLAAWDFITKFEAGGIRYNRESSKREESELLAHFQEDVFAILSKGDGDYDGILLLIDEADKPPAEAGLGLMCKLLTEELSRRRCEQLCIGIAGLPGVMDRLSESHESSPRIFKTMQLKPLEQDECGVVLDSGLRAVKEKTNIDVTIAPEARTLIARLSEGYPHFLQEFAYAAYEEDSDNEVGREDVLNSLFKENGPFEQLGRKFFAQFYAAPSSDDYRTVLHVMSDHFDEWVDRSQIIKDSGLKDSTVDNALRALKAKNIILQDDARRGKYRLPTRAFAIWLKGQKRVKDVSEARAAAAAEPDKTG